MKCLFQFFVLNTSNQNETPYLLENNFLSNKRDTELENTANYGKKGTSYTKR